LTAEQIRHHPLRPGQIDAPHRRHRLGDFRLESGDVIEDCVVSYVTHGALAPARDNAVLALTAIGATHHRLDFLIGDGRALDPRRWFIIVVDALGNGLSSSPSNSRTQPGPRFPCFSIRDMVESQRRLLHEVFDLPSLATVIGASMGGMQALQWAVSHGTAMRSVVALTPMARTTAWSQLVNESARRALTSDPAWRGGAYERQPEDGWRQWTLVLRGLANRTPAALAAMPSWRDWVAAAENDTLESAVDANDWIAQSHAYDMHDLGTTPGFDGDTARALASIYARTLIAAPPLDLYNPADAARQAAESIPGARYIEIPSIQGHQAANVADPGDVAFLNRRIGAFLNELQEEGRET
jgi:homoserine O-acetyltransferase/O-succinyltransferase